MAVIRVQGTDVEVDAREDEPVLTAFQRCGYSYIVGCKRGGCGICKLELVEGTVDYLKPVAQTVLPDEDRESIALSCRSVPVTDILLHMPEGSKFRAIAPFLASLAKAQAASAAAAKTGRDAAQQVVAGAAVATATAATGVAMNAAADALQASTKAASEAQAKLSEATADAKEKLAEAQAAFGARAQPNGAAAVPDPGPAEAESAEPPPTA